MTPTSQTHRRGRLAFLGAALATFLLLFVPALPAAAHDELVSADPGIDATVDALPDELVMTFSGELIPDGGATQVEVTDAEGRDLTDGTPVVDGALVRQDLSGDADGTVRVLWRVVSGDGHPVSGEFLFGVGSAPTPLPEPGESTEDEGSNLILIGGLIAIVGAAGVLFAVFFFRRRTSDDEGSAGSDGASEGPAER